MKSTDQFFLPDVTDPPFITFTVDKYTQLLGPNTRVARAVRWSDDTGVTELSYSYLGHKNCPIHSFGLTEESVGQ